MSETTAQTAPVARGSVEDDANKVLAAHGYLRWAPGEWRCQCGAPLGAFEDLVGVNAREVVLRAHQIRALNDADLLAKTTARTATMPDGVADLAVDLRPGPFQPLGGWAHAIPPAKRDAILALINLVDVLTATAPTPGRRVERGHAKGCCCPHCQSTFDSTTQER